MRRSLIICSNDCLSCPYLSVDGRTWKSVAEEVCSSDCISDRAVCPWLMVCRCVNPLARDDVGRRLERLAESPAAAVATVIAADRVVLPPNGVRQQRSEDAVTELQQSIGRHGLLSPPVGIARPDGTVEIISGVTRVMALLRLGWSGIPVRILHLWNPDPTRILVIGFQENAVRTEMTWSDQVRAVERIWEDLGRPTVRRLAAVLGKSTYWVHQRLIAARSQEDHRIAVGKIAAAVSSRSNSRRRMRLRFSRFEIGLLLRVLGVTDATMDFSDVALAHTLIRALDSSADTCRVRLREEEVLRLLELMGVQVTGQETWDDLRQLLRDALDCSGEVNNVGNGGPEDALDCSEVMGNEDATDACIDAGGDTGPGT